jgi:hypothetical protein
MCHCDRRIDNEKKVVREDYSVRAIRVKDSRKNYMNGEGCERKIPEFGQIY